MAANVVVRNVVAQDYDQWLPLWEGYNAFYGRSGATALAPEITAMTWARFFDAYEPVHALVAESGGALQGRRPRLDQRRVRPGEARGIFPRLLADPRDQPHRHAALRQGGGAF